MTFITINVFQNIKYTNLKLAVEDSLERFNDLRKQNLNF